VRTTRFWNNLHQVRSTSLDIIERLMLNGHAIFGA